MSWFWFDSWGLGSGVGSYCWRRHDRSTAGNVLGMCLLFFNFEEQLANSTFNRNHDPYICAETLKNNRRTVLLLFAGCSSIVPLTISNSLYMA